MRFLIATALLFNSHVYAQEPAVQALPSILNHLSPTELVLMEEGDKLQTKGQGLRGLERLLRSRQLRSELLLGRALADRKNAQIETSKLNLPNVGSGFSRGQRTFPVPFTGSPGVDR